MGTIIYYSVILNLEFDEFFENVNLANNFWKASAIALIFNMSIPCDETFPWEPTSLTLEFGLHSENFNIANNISTVSARVFIFHMNGTKPFDLDIMKKKYL